MISSTTFAIIAGIASLVAGIASMFTAVSASREQDEYQKKLLELNEVTAYSVTGGDGYCYVNIYPDTLGKALVEVISESKYPLYDIEIQVRPWLFIDNFSVNKNEAEAYRNSTDFDEVYNYKVGTLPSMKSQLSISRRLGLVPFDTKRRWFYTIDYTARNGEWTQVWELSLDEEGSPITSHVIYKTVIENHVFKRNVIKKSIHPKADNSVIELLIKEYKLYDS